MKKTRWPVDIQIQSNLKCKWYNIDKNIYDEDGDKTIKFKLFGMTLFNKTKGVSTIHNIEEAMDLPKKVGGFAQK